MKRLNETKLREEDQTRRGARTFGELMENKRRFETNDAASW